MSQVLRKLAAMQPFQYARVLTIAGSDSGGGAGIQADIKTISALGCYAATVITAVTVQNTLGVRTVHGIPAHIVEGQLTAVLDDITPQAIKIGMLFSEELVSVVSHVLAAHPDVPIVLDPVLLSTSGHRLMAAAGMEKMKAQLLPLISLLTPNLGEAAALTGLPVTNPEEMEHAAYALLSCGSKAVLIKGGHLQSTTLTDLYLSADGTKSILETPAIVSPNLHGTGCTLSSAIAAFLARGQAMDEALRSAKTYLTAAIEAGRDVATGKGHGPLNHLFAPEPLGKYLR